MSRSNQVMSMLKKTLKPSQAVTMSIWQQVTKAYLVSTFQEMEKEVLIMLT